MIDDERKSITGINFIKEFVKYRKKMFFAILLIGLMLIGMVHSLTHRTVKIEYKNGHKFIHSN